ncbi:hypothetical protein ACJMK2_012672 [Sinanodonta woodiana]|uniref:Uncharacterized protein n=1 Tax=Sinanodonta woodiana TaxID=1069815 RepID=A0ABD3VA65_SINWO
MTCCANNEQITSGQGFNADQIAHQIRNSIINNYSVFVAELEPKIIGTCFLERRLMYNALYEKICQLRSRGNRVVAFLKWLLDEERPEAYFAFQNVVKMFYSEKFVKLLESTELLSTCK